jgi:pyruvate/2-oxoglutarate/acetoin dehydrogenase E1 component
MNFRSEMAQAFGMERQSPNMPLATSGINGEPINMNDQGVATAVNAMTKDYSALMKAIDKKKGK